MELVVNGVPRRLRGDAERSLLSVLRDDLDLIGAKYGCGEAQCGACIVLLDGQPVPSCVTPVGAAAGKAVLTIEGLAPGASSGDGPVSAPGTADATGAAGRSDTMGRLHPVQQAFVDEVAMQCGYCTPGMVMMAVALLRQTPHPSDDEIVRFMDGNLCRCGVYPRIVRAIRRAAEMMAREGNEP